MLIEEDYQDLRIVKRKVPEGSYCNRCQSPVTNDSFRDRNYLDNYFIHRLCGRCQDITMNDGERW